MSEGFGAVIARNEATKQSSLCARLDCFAVRVVGPRDFARVRWFAVTMRSAA